MLGKNQQQMADILGLSRQSYSKKECGHIPFKDSEKVLLKDMFIKFKNDLTIDELFFLD